MDTFLLFKMIPLLAMAGSAGGQNQGGAGQMIALMFPMIFLFIVMYFLMIRPQMKQEKQRKEMLSRIKKNDKVITKGGIIGKVLSAKDDILVVQIDPQKDVCIRMRREGVNVVLNDEKQKNGESVERAEIAEDKAKSGKKKR